MKKGNVISEGAPRRRGRRGGWLKWAALVCGVGMALPAAAASYAESVLFGFNGSNGSAPGGQLIEASDGNFYGTTCKGGANTSGVVWKLTPAGVESTIYTFSAGTPSQSGGTINTDGACPNGVTQGADGNLYGTTHDGGTNATGVIFRLGRDGTGFSVLHSFGISSAADMTVQKDASIPQAALIPGTDSSFGGSFDTSYFYGSTRNGGQYDAGAIFRVSPAGSYQVIYSFGAQNTSDGDGPIATLLQGDDGKLYGVNFEGGTQGGGTAFQLDPNTFALATLHNFTIFESNTGDGYEPRTNLIEGTDGAFYGSTAYGGSAGKDDGTLFKVDRNGNFTLLHSFLEGNSNGTPPQPYGMLLGTDGLLYSTTQDSQDSTSGGVYNSTLNSATYTTLYGFASASAPNDGHQPNGTMLQTSDGSFIGSLGSEGQNATINGGGAIFKLAANPALAAPVQLSLSASSVVAGTSTTLSWTTRNATSKTYSLCFASDAWTGYQSATGSMSVTPTTPGTYRYALTCAGVESGSVTLTVTPAPPTVSIRANPTTFNQGGSTTLQWSSTNATTCTASGGWSGAQSTNGSSTQTPASAGNVTYTLTCTGAAGPPATASTTVTVKALPTVTIAVNPTSIVLGNTATLTWSSTNATSCNATGAWSGSVATSGSQSEQPTTTGDYTYSLSCSSDGGTTNAVAHATLTVTAAPPLPTVTIGISPSRITQGGSATLTWSSTNATSCTASGDWSGGEPVNGTQSVTPNSAGSKTYTLTCTGAGGSASSSARLTVDAAPSTLVINVNPTSIVQGNSATLMWSSSNTTNCNASGAWSGSEPSSGMQVVSPATAGSYTYTLTCTGNSGGGEGGAVMIEGSTTLTVTPAPAAAPTVTIGVNPVSMVVGSSASLSWSSTNATACTASNAWSGSEPVNGTLVVSPATPGTYTYTLSCTGNGGTASSAATLTVTPAEVVPPPPPPAPATGTGVTGADGGNGGAFGPALLLPIAGLAALRRRRRRALQLASALAIVGAAPFTAQADEVVGLVDGKPLVTAGSRFYVGLRGGPTYADESSKDVTNAVRARGDDVSVHVDSHDKAGSLFVGLRFTPILALEADVSRLGRYKVSASGTTNDPDKLAQDIADNAPHGAGLGGGLRARLTIPFTQQLMVSTSGGAYYWKRTTDIDIGDRHYSFNNDHVGMSFSLDMRYVLARRYELSLGMEMDGPDTHNLVYQPYFGVQYDF